MPTTYVRFGQFYFNNKNVIWQVSNDEKRALLVACCSRSNQVTLPSFAYLYSLTPTFGKSCMERINRKNSIPISIISITADKANADTGFTDQPYFTSNTYIIENYDQLIKLTNPFPVEKEKDFSLNISSLFTRKSSGTNRKRKNTNSPMGKQVNYSNYASNYFTVQGINNNHQNIQPVTITPRYSQMGASFHPMTQAMFHQAQPILTYFNPNTQTTTTLRSGTAWFDLTRSCDLLARQEGAPIINYLERFLSDTIYTDQILIIDFPGLIYQHSSGFSVKLRAIPKQTPMGPTEQVFLVFESERERSARREEIYNYLKSKIEAETTISNNEKDEYKALLAEQKSNDFQVRDSNNNNNRFIPNKHVLLLPYHLLFTLSRSAKASYLIPEVMPGRPVATTSNTSVVGTSTSTSPAVQTYTPYTPEFIQQYTQTTQARAGQIVQDIQQREALSLQSRADQRQPVLPLQQAPPLRQVFSSPQALSLQQAFSQRQAAFPPQQPVLPLQQAFPPHMQALMQHFSQRQALPPRSASVLSEELSRYYKQEINTYLPFLQNLPGAPETYIKLLECIIQTDRYQVETIKDIFLKPLFQEQCEKKCAEILNFIDTEVTEVTKVRPEKRLELKDAYGPIVGELTIANAIDDLSRAGMTLYQIEQFFNDCLGVGETSPVESDFKQQCSLILRKVAKIKDDQDFIVGKKNALESIRDSLEKNRLPIVSNEAYVRIDDEVDTYSFCFISNDDATLKEHTLYVGVQEDKEGKQLLVYTVITPQGVIVKDVPIFLDTLPLNTLTTLKTTLSVNVKYEILQITSKNGHTAVDNKLFYINQKTKECKEILLDKEKMKKFDEMMKPTFQLKILSEEQLKQITLLTGHHIVLKTKNENIQPHSERINLYGCAQAINQLYKYASGIHHPGVAKVQDDTSNPKILKGFICQTISELIQAEKDKLEVIKLKKIRTELELTVNGSSEELGVRLNQLTEEMLINHSLLETRLNNLEEQIRQTNYWIEKLFERQTNNNDQSNILVSQWSPDREEPNDRSDEDNDDFIFYSPDREESSDMHDEYKDDGSIPHSDDRRSSKKLRTSQYDLHTLYPAKSVQSPLHDLGMPCEEEAGRGAVHVQERDMNI